jgi:endonuclease/exonuclease/phosphatase family metal-dependent hydrolase
MNNRKKGIRVATWNIHGCVGSDGRHDIERIGEVIKRIAPDVAAFQEVDTRRKSEQQTDTYGYLRSQVGLHGHEAWSISGADGDYGQMLASRFKLDKRKVYDISIPGREKRKVMEACVRLPTGAVVRVISTHLGVRRAERRRQAVLLREIVDSDLSTPMMLLGDLNEWSRRGAAWSLFSGIFDDYTAHASFPARFPVLALDRILVRPGGTVVRSWIDRQAYPSSDHLPVVADLAFR